MRLDAGVLVPRGGPIYTMVTAFLDSSRAFTGWTNYQHKVRLSINDQLMPVPFNHRSLETPLEKAERGEKLYRSWFLRLVRTLSSYHGASEKNDQIWKRLLTTFTRSVFYATMNSGG